jgi:hypothetical protein
MFPSALAQEGGGILSLTRVDGDDGDIRLDGRLDEAVWQRVPVVDGMRVVVPDTLASAPMQTETRIFYTERGIYVGVMNHQPPGTLVARMSSRDADLERDGFMVAIDPSGEGFYGYFMQINLGGTMRDGTILPERQFNRQWDGPWDAETAELENGWSAEIFIPWSMMSLPHAEGTRRIGVYLERSVAVRNETWSWPALPGTRTEFLSAFQKYELSGIDPRTQFTFYPYASSTFNNITNQTDYRTGADFYWRPSSNLQLSATVNPDFGTVESDDIVVNLGAFETFFSEKRSFFLEEQDIFNTSPRDSGGPFGPTTLLNTRRIGAAAWYDTPAGARLPTAEVNQPTDLLGALKLTGQAGGLRYGALLASEDDSQLRGRMADGSIVPVTADGRDFAVGRLLYETSDGSGRKGIGWIGTHMNHTNREATVNGIDLHYFSADTRWLLDGQLVRSDVDGTTGQGMYFDVNYRPARGVQHSVTGTYLDDTINLNDVGYVQRNDFIQLDYRLNISESGLEKYRTRGMFLNLINQWNTDGRPVRLGIFAGRGVTYHNNSALNTQLRYFPKRVDDRLSRGNGTFKIPDRVAVDVSWRSDRAKPLSYSLMFSSAQEDLGHQNLTYRAGAEWQPNDRFAINADLRYTDREAWLIHRGGTRFTSFEAVEWGPRVDANYFISAKQQFRLSMQWTGIKAYEDGFYQIDPTRVDYLTKTPKPTTSSDSFSISRMSFQARYRWEIAPLSDLFLVYTRGSSLPGTFDGDFNEMFTRAWTDKIVDTWVLKLRYRLGS